MMDWLSKIPQWIQIPLKILLPSLTIFSGFIMFSSEAVLEKLYLLQFRETSGFALGLLFVISFSLIICYIGSFLILRLSFLYKAKLKKKREYKLFMSLADVYKKTLIEMYKSPTHSLKMEISNSVADYLQSIRAISRSSVSTVGVIFDFYLLPWVEDSIKKMCSDINLDIYKLKVKLKQVEPNDTEHDKILEEIQKNERVLEYIMTESEME